MGNSRIIVKMWVNVFPSTMLSKKIHPKSQTYLVFACIVGVFIDTKLEHLCL